MSNVEKAIEQKLANARAKSDKKDVNPSDKISEGKKASASSGSSSSANKDEGKAPVKNPPNAGSQSNNANAKSNNGKATANQKASPSGTVVKKGTVKASNPKAKSGANVKKTDAKPLNPKASTSGVQSVASAKKNDGKVVSNQKAVTAGVQTANSSAKKTPISKATSSSPKKVAAKPVVQKGSQAASNASKDGTKPQSGTNNVKKVVGKSSVSEVKPDINSDKVRKENAKPEQKDKTKVDKSKKTDASNGKTESNLKNDDKNADDKEPRTDSLDRKSRKRSRSKSSRERSRSPMLFRRNYNYSRNLDFDHNRRKYDGGRSSYRRSPDRRRTRSPLPPRRRSRSASRRSPSPRRYDSRRRSPRRRSRSPRNRTRSRSRSYRDRSRSTDRNRDPKALRAKKSFLDDLAVKFAQEGKEFPELEQYRCEINSQFVQYPVHKNQFSMNAVEHSIASNDPYMDMDVCPPADPINTPIVLTDPYNAYPLYGETQTIVPYPMLGEQLAMHSPALDSPQASMESFQQDKISVANSADRPRSTGSQPSASTEIWTKQEVKLRIKQAMKLLDDADSGITKTAKFLYRAPTFHGKGINEGRSPVLKSDKNPTFAFSCRSTETSDPFGNIPRKLKPVIDVLRMDEGQISYRILQLHHQKQLALIATKDKLQAEERARRQLGIPASNTTLQKTTQTDPTVCTDCLLRKIKVRYNGETQTDIVRTVDSVAQTNPMPVQAVSEFGSITELTPNQVRAVSELIKYIKLTVTSGTVTEIRDSLREDQVYNLNSDLQTAYNYFDAMVEHKNSSKKERNVGNVPFETTDDFNDPGTLIEDENFATEDEEFHKNVWDDEFIEDEELESCSNPLLQGQPTGYHQDTRDSFARNTGSSYGSTGGNFGGPSTSSRTSVFQQQQHRHGDGREMNKGPHYAAFNRRNY